MDVVKEEKGVDGEESHSSGSGFKGRFLTSDRTDLMGSEWRLLRWVRVREGGRLRGRGSVFVRMCVCVC